MDFPTITALTGAVLLALQQGLMLNTGFHRVSSGVAVGITDDRHLERKMRRHGNLAENAAIFVVVLGLLELLTGTTVVVKVFGIAFVSARVMHALGFSSLVGSHLEEGSKIFVVLRSTGATLSALIGFCLSGYLIFLITTI